MKKVVFIGKFNTAFEDINNYLANYLNVQMCVDNVEMVKGILRLNQPELVIVSMIGFGPESAVIFEELKSDRVAVPVLCIGTQKEQELFKEALQENRFHTITSPADNDEILRVVFELLGIDDELETKRVIRPMGQRKCVMLIDDSAFLLRTLNEMLKDKYDVMLATSGMKALTMIGQRVPDIIFLDYAMPMCDGVMTMQMIREVEEAKDIPIVFLTGVCDKEHIEAVLELRPAGYLLKPPSAKSIYKFLDKYLED